MNPFRTLIITLMLSVVAILIFTAATRASNGSDSPSHIVVGKGDTLWSIAVHVAPKADPRCIIAEIKTLNGLETARVYPGQRLTVPAADR